MFKFHTSSLCKLIVLFSLVFTSSFGMAKTLVEQPLTQAVKWHRISKEYQILTSSLYASAAINIAHQEHSAENWVVVMDVDETLLDNSEYQRRLDTSGATFNDETWTKWIKEQHATPIPGALHFVKTVLDAGGKLVLITNRAKKMDKYTWANLASAGFPINSANACLMGRSEQDKLAVNNDSILNDKDRRREIVLKGKPECFETSGNIPNSWKKPVSIDMQIGDNIQDIQHITQENADVDALVKRQGKDILLLPNAMYGSWN